MKTWKGLWDRMSEGGWKIYHGIKNLKAKINRQMKMTLKRGCQNLA
jgi:hypothetical protein